MLQAYALKEFLIRKGNEVFFVDYKLSCLTRRYTFFQLYIYKDKSFRFKLHYVFNILKHAKYRYLQKKRFECFQKQMFPEIKLSEINNLDFIVVGSDQIWNPQITCGYDGIYYGELSKKGIPHISYAASCPASLIKKELSSFFENFRSIGVRERTTLLKLKQIGFSPYMTIDPTFLLSCDDYQMLLPRNNQKDKKDYLFIYDLNGNHKIFDLASSFKQKFGWSIAANHTSRVIKIDSVYRDAGPAEFLKLIYEAKCTIVSSFHGVAFSIIFQKPFVYYPFNSEKDERAMTIITTLGLEQCVWTEHFVLDRIFKMNWAEANKKLTMLKGESINFLTESLYGE